MTLGLKAYRIMMGHLTRKTPDKKISDLINTGKLKTADEISQPPKKQEVENIEAFNEFNKRNPKADGGRMEFQFGGGADAQRMGTEASRVFFKNRSVDKPTPTFEGGTGKARVTDAKFKNPTQEKEYIKILEDRFKFPKGSKEARKVASNADISKKFGISLNNVERVNKALINKLNLKYPTQTYEGYEKIQRERDKVRKENIKKTSSGSVESKIKRDIKKVNPTALAKDVDIAHRASLKANANLGAKYLTTSLGIDSKIINQKIIQPIEQKLGTLYENQKKLIKNYKPGDKIPKDIQKKLEKVNIKISELADRTNGVLQGVLVDEKTLKPITYGVDYSKVLGFGLVDKPVSELTQADRDIIKLNVEEQIKTAKKVDPKNTGMKLNAKIPGLTDLFEMAKTIPDDIKKAKYLKAGFKSLGIAAAPIVIYDTYKAFEQGRPILEALEAGLIGTDLIGGTKRVMSLNPEEREARSVVKQDALKDLNVDMPMGFGFIEGPTPKTNISLEEAKQKMNAGIQRVREEEAKKNLLRSQNRGFGTPVMADQFLVNGGIVGVKSGPPPEKGPNSQGLPSLIKRVKKL